MSREKYRHKCIIQQPGIDTVDTLGHTVESWTQYSQQWFSIRHMRGRELEAAQQLYGEVDTVFEGWQEKHGLTPDMRILFDRADSTIGLAIATTGAAVQVVSSAEFPRQGLFDIRVQDELMTVSAGYGTTALTAARAQHGTSASTHNLGTAAHVQAVADIVVPMIDDENDRKIRIFTKEVM